MTTTVDQTLAPALQLPPRYQIRAILKETPATCVYRVFELAGQADEAIKILRHELSEPQQLLRFKTEFSTLASLEHESIIKVREYGLLHERFPYFTMEYFAGKKISEYFDGHSWPALYDVILQIASALHHIHHLGVIHLDLKPSNILVDERGRAKIMDFGVALESRQVLDRQIRGSLHYMPPEVLKQDRVDSRADLYSLGMTLYETVTGALPGYGKPSIEVIRMHLDEEIRPPSSINPRVPPELEQIIMRLLEKDPRHRYASAASLLHDVAAAAGKKADAGELLVGRGELFAAPLIGRKVEVAQLASMIANARDGRGDGVVVAGAEGMGKSRIVRDATLRAQLEGARVFRGRCPINGKTIYAPFFEIFQQMVVAVNPEADVSGEIRRLLRPVVLAAEGEEATPATGQKYRLFNRIVQAMQDMYGFLSASTAGGESNASPLILVFEDVQWADPSTAELFSFLIGEAKQNRLLVIGTLTIDSTGEASAEPGRHLAEWERRAREGSFLLIRVEALSEPLVREHLQSLLGEEEIPADLVRWTLWESAGSPLIVRRVVDYLIAHGYLHWEPQGWVAEMERIQALRIPGGAASILMERVDALPPANRELIEAAAVFGESSGVDLLTGVASAVPETAYRALREVVTLGLLDESNDGKTIVFPQIHLREAIYNAMTERRRTEMHQRVAAVLEPSLEAGSTQLLGQVAFHYARAGDKSKGVRYAVEAGDMAMRTIAHQGATEFFRSALELMDLAGAEEAQKSEVREKLADAYYRGNDYRAAIQAYQFLLKSIQARSDDDAPNADLARVMKKIGKVLAKRGEQEAALSYFQNAIDQFETLGMSIEVAELLNRIAWLHREKDDPEGARASAERALQLLNPDEPNIVFGYVINMLGCIEYNLGNWQKSRELLIESLKVGERVGSERLCKVASTNLGNTLWKLGDWVNALQYYKMNLALSESEGDLWDLITAYNNVGIIEFSCGEFQVASEYFEKSVRIDEKIGAVEYEALARENLAEAFEMLGRWNDALVQYNRCLALQGFDDTRASRSSVYIPMARLMNKKGDIVKAMAYAQKALAAAERARDEDLIAEASYVLANIEDERENYAEAERHLARSMSIFESHQTTQGLARAHTAAASMAFTQQRIDEATRHATLGAKFAGQLDDRFTLAKNDWIWGKILSSQGDREAANVKFDAARATFEELQTPYELARLLFDVGLLKDEPEEATQTIRGAIRIFERLEATHDLERARGALFRIKPAGKAPDSGVVGLYEVVKIINSTLNLEEVLNRVLDLAIRRVRAERGMILLLDPITSALRTRIARNIKDTEGGSRRSPQSIVKEVIQSGQSVISADARADERFVESESVIAENIMSILCVPLVIRDRIAGAIYVDHREARHLFSQKDLTFIEAFADQAAIAIENARLYEELEEARARLSLENESLRRQVLVEKHLDSVVGNSEAVARIQFAIRKASSGHSTVLVRGESGTGKGLIARIIHNVSPRRNGPFIMFNCAALPENLAESELFGHEKGSFTGADRRKLGRFELANGGTIFLDEIGKISLAVQAKLLRVVEDKEFERVGGTQTIKTDVKIIAATNLDIEKAIEQGTFREDLYYRLNIIPLVLPPLRARKDDIPLLAEHFIKKICKDLGVETKRLAPGVLDLFTRYNWPGNIRELEATIHRAIVMSNEETITRNDFYGLMADPGGASATAHPLPMPASMLNSLIGRMEITGELYNEVVLSIDRQLIERALELSGGRLREAARRLGMARNTLKLKMQKYKLEAQD
ncbi:MAG TPA: sigma 54-interacting transcriptional regulator [Thermoanaerobaculia bacterium]|jgi:Nif-specific regulatory protein|nr:sigma 54-interacting transcriptional regulator [Thermoanaerobaculia bacterium]